MGAPPLRPYERPETHQAVAEIIRRHSANQQDVRAVALDGLDLSFAHRVLELGCGFGFMSETVAARLPPKAHFLGVDACPANEQPFLERVSVNGIAGQFSCQCVGPRLPWSDQSFDLIVCSYSLYFFAEALPEIARMLTPDGLLLVITHSEESCRTFFDGFGLETKGEGLAPIVRPFSAENGGDLLARWFQRVESIPYPNHLLFTPDHRLELLAYIQSKLPLLAEQILSEGLVPAVLQRAVAGVLASRGEVRVGKDDACFRGWGPRC